MLPIPDDQRRAGSLPNDVFGDAPQKQVFQPGAPTIGFFRGDLMLSPYISIASLNC